MFSFSKKLLAAGVASTIVGAAAVSLPVQAAGGGTLVIGTTQKPRHLNPAVQSGVATAIPGTQIFASPLRFDENWNPQPYLAESWKVSDDGKTVTLNLRKNAKFHDGKPVTSADVAFSIDTVKANHPFKTMFAPVSSVDTPDAHTVVINLANPHPAILLSLSPALLPVLPKHVYGDGQDAKSHPRNSKNPIGSGPFKLVEFKPGQHVILAKNADYFLEGKPYLDKVIIKNYKDAASLVLATDKGEVNMTPFISGVRDIARLKKNNKLVVTNKGYGGVGPVNWLAFNHKHEILAKKEVRQAISYAIDRNFVTKVLHAGQSTRATGPIHNDSPFYNPNVNKYDLDLDKANALLDAAGYKKGANGERFSLTIDYIPGIGEMGKGLAEYIRSALKKVGIKIVVRAAPDFPTWAKRVGGHKFELSMDILFNWGDPVIGVHRTYISSNIRPGVIWSNTQSYSNPKVDEILTQAGMETDPAKRAALYKTFQEIVTDELPVAYINLLPYHTAYQKTLQNPPMTIWGAMSPMDEIKLGK